MSETNRADSVRSESAVLVAVISNNSSSNGRPLEEFTDNFVCPLVEVGPTSPLDIRLNSPARLIAERLGLNKPAEVVGWRADDRTRQAG